MKNLEKSEHNNGSELDDVGNLGCKRCRQQNGIEIIQTTAINRLILEQS